MKRIAGFLSGYGMVAVLIVLCIFFSLVTWAEQHPNGAEGAEQLLKKIPPSASVLIVARANEQDAQFADRLKQLLASTPRVVHVVKGHPPDARRELERLSKAGGPLDIIACNNVTAQWGVFDAIPNRYPNLSGAKVLQPASYSWPNFLKTENLLNIANQIAVIAILAIGMTMVIITGGIDLSVGSLIALSAVFAAWLIRGAAGGEDAGTFAMILCALAAILLCSGAGAFSGSMVTLFGIPPFIATLGMMLVASGFSYIIAEGQSINQVPDTFIWLGRGADLFGLPNAVALMIILYALTHVLMARTALGRYIYAVGGNREAARLSGVPVKRVLFLVYTACGALAGLGGVVMASQLKSGAPTYGIMYELYVIAAVVVGGTSLSGGHGKILGTLVGAFIIAVIQNGMNLTGVESYTQKVILGAVILGAVVLDRLRGRDWSAVGFG